MAGGIPVGFVLGGAAAVGAVGGGSAYAGHLVARHGERTQQPVLQVGGRMFTGAVLGAMAGLTLVRGNLGSVAAAGAGAGAVAGALFGASEVAQR